MRQIEIKIGKINVRATLNFSKTADKIHGALPLRSIVQVWGKELYFTIPVNANLELTAKEEVEIGDLAFWPTGNAFCIFWGKTPASKGEKPAAISPVNVFGSVEGNLDVLNDICDGDIVEITSIPGNLS